MKTPIVYDYIQEFKKNDFQHFDLFYESIKKDVFYNILKRLIEVDIIIIF